ncbi:FKBP-type peptidyl-prolyl cis-trans isomerase [Jiulongibacter sp. NS-SX5]|uniref:FKBP-type peptidyl-prolyl cis-trans isomerase n=1 Tax=Jiulongibacter sp. NS-SX5 TaxID=3463854 RepID=UPI004059630D
MNLRNTLIIVAISGLAISCNQFKVTETADGSRIQYHAKGDSDVSPVEGDMISFDLKIITEQDSVFKDTWAEGKPIEIPLPKAEFTPSFESALLSLHEGDSATVYVSSDSLFGRIGQPLPPGVLAGSDLKFLVKLRDIQTKEEYQASLEKKKEEEADIIAKYVEENHKGATKLDNGIYYTTSKNGRGATVVAGDTVEVSYVGKFMDGNIFDQNETMTFPVATGYVIKGWDEALQTMKVGQKSTFVIPSYLGYGDRGIGPIGPFTPLVFDIELKKIGSK